MLTAALISIAFGLLSNYLYDLVRPWLTFPGGRRPSPHVNTTDQSPRISRDMALSEGSLTLRLLEEPEEVGADELEPTMARHTGAPLRRAQLRFRAHENGSKQVSDRLKRAHKRDEALVDADGCRWIVASNSYSYTNGDVVHQHVVEVQEVEMLEIQRLEFLGLTLEPTVYEEEADDVCITISAILEPSDAAVGAALDQAIIDSSLSDERPYFDVVRIGISDEPLHMRFGRCLWSDEGEGKAHLIRLVESKFDDDEETNGIARWFQPELRWAMQRAAESEEGIVALVEELKAAGVIDAAVADRINERIAGAYERRFREFDRVKDLRGFL